MLYAISQISHNDYDDDDDDDNKDNNNDSNTGWPCSVSNEVPAEIMENDLSPKQISNR